MSKSKEKPWYAILQLKGKGFLDKKTKFLNVACMLHHLNIPKGQRVILLKLFCLEKMLATERIFSNKPIYKCVYRRGILSAYPRLVSQRAGNHISNDFVIVPDAVVLIDHKLKSDFLGIKL